MEKNTANDVLNTLHAAAFIVDKTLADVQGTCPEEQFRASASLLAHAMSDMAGFVMEPIYNEHPDLAPDWYRDGPPGGGPDIPNIEAPPEVRRALLAAFEAAYEKVQSALERVSRLPDPADVALYSLGLHRISATLCRARMALLLAKPA
jgi:hypothetical protein